MFIRVASTGKELTQPDIDRIQQEMAKLDRRLQKVEEPYLDIHVSGDESAPAKKATMRLEFGSRHLVASAEDADVFRAIRAGREELLSQIERAGRGTHSEYSKGS